MITMELSPIPKGNRRFDEVNLSTSLARRESECPIPRRSRLIDVTLSGFKAVELASPTGTVVSGALSLGADLVATDGESREGIGGYHALIERESDPYDLTGWNADGMLGRVDGHAGQRNLTIGSYRNLVHIGNIQSGQLSSPSASVVGGALGL